MSNERVRVRFAPSPTGPLHIGGVRTALYNYLFARRHGGQFILRIEDTDSQRFVPGAEAYIVEALKWCGLTTDEGVEQGGPHAPYRQSERRAIYKQYAEQLIASGNAYYAFDAASDLEARRSEAEKQGRAFAYDHTVRETLDNSLHLPSAEVQARLQRGDAYVVRFKMPANEDVVMDDLIRGRITINTATLDDKVLYKSADQLPTYHLANIVDDHLMQITHVIRGEEWLPSLPLHYLLYKAFGWEATRPQFAHLPLLLKPQGQGKLSKRDGDKFGFPVFPLDWRGDDGKRTAGFREEGYLPAAFVNMLALLGWNPGTEQELFTLEELVENFSLEKVSKSGARFNPDKAKWFNQQYLRQTADDALARMSEPLYRARGIAAPRERLAEAIGLIKERATFPADLVDLTLRMFVRPDTYDEKSVRKTWHSPATEALRVLRSMLITLPVEQPEAAEAKVQEWIKAEGISIGPLMSALRIAIWGQSNGPSIFHIIAFIGRDEALARIDDAFAKLRD